MPNSRAVDILKRELDSAFDAYEIYLLNAFSPEKRKSSKEYQRCSEELDACRQMTNRFGEFDIVMLRKAIEDRASTMTMRARWYQFHIKDYLWPLRILLYSKLEQRCFSIFNLMTEENRILKERSEASLRNELNNTKKELQETKDELMQSRHLHENVVEECKGLRHINKSLVDKNIEFNLQVEFMIKQLAELTSRMDAIQLGGFQPLLVGNIQEQKRPENHQTNVIGTMSNFIFGRRH